MVLHYWPQKADEHNTLYPKTCVYLTLHDKINFVAMTKLILNYLGESNIIGAFRRRMSCTGEAMKMLPCWLCIEREKDSEQEIQSLIGGKG